MCEEIMTYKPRSTKNIPLGLYIHIPWCIKKCPYCDFNSHAKQGELPEKAYIARLILDFKSQLHAVQDRPIHSIFIGGGTPSLFSNHAYETLFSTLRDYVSFSPEIEITLEANPGTIDCEFLEGYLKAGINRLSFGVQSFQNEKLHALGRIHSAKNAQAAVKTAQKIGFKNINIDLMFGLENQTIGDALSDLRNAIALSPQHISWYQLTLEPNTFFYRFPPPLPDDDVKLDMQLAGQTLLAKNNFSQYEISAYARNNRQCQHNLNYWRFGDYLGIGAGAHAKWSCQTVIRRTNTKHPKAYLSGDTISCEEKKVTRDELALEFMLNAMRLHEPITQDLFFSRTGFTFSDVESQLKHAQIQSWLHYDAEKITLTERGKLFLNEVLMLF